MSDTTEKKCTGPCNRVLPATREFFTSSHSKSGLSNECLACIQVRARANRLARLARERGESNQGDDTPTRNCIKCHRSYPATSEYFDLDDPVRTHKSKTGRECIRCKTFSKKVKETCTACGTNNGNLRGDINIATGERYGILCAKCHQLVQAAKEDSERVAQVARYLKKTRQNNPPRPHETGHQTPS
jgi:hypothetical protein